MYQRERGKHRERHNCNKYIDIVELFVNKVVYIGDVVDGRHQEVHKHCKALLLGIPPAYEIYSNHTRKNREHLYRVVGHSKLSALILTLEPSSEWVGALLTAAAPCIGAEMICRTQVALNPLIVEGVSTPGAHLTASDALVRHWTAVHRAPVTMRSRAGHRGGLT